MKNKDDKNVETITLEGELTPLEQFEERRMKRALFAKLLQETQALVEGIEKLPELKGIMGLDEKVLEEVTNKALVTLADEMEEHFGVSA
jgi:hypothetical protein